MSVFNKFVAAFKHFMFYDEPEVKPKSSEAFDRFEQRMADLRAERKAQHPQVYKPTPPPGRIVSESGKVRSRAVPTTPPSEMRRTPVSSFQTVEQVDATPQIVNMLLVQNMLAQQSMASIYSPTSDSEYRSVPAPASFSCPAPEPEYREPEPSYSCPAPSPAPEPSPPADSYSSDSSSSSSSSSSWD